MFYWIIAFLYCMPFWHFGSKKCKTKCKWGKKTAKFNLLMQISQRIMLTMRWFPAFTVIASNRQSCCQLSNNLRSHRVSNYRSLLSTLISCSIYYTYSITKFPFRLQLKDLRSQRSWQAWYSILKVCSRRPYLVSFHSLKVSRVRANYFCPPSRLN